jgi:hypothetical protein
VVLAKLSLTLGVRHGGGDMPHTFIGIDPKGRRLHNCLQIPAASAKSDNIAAFAQKTERTSVRSDHSHRKLPALSRLQSGLSRSNVILCRSNVILCRCNDLFRRFNAVFSRRYAVFSRCNVIRSRLNVILQPA